MRELIIKLLLVVCVAQVTTGSTLLHRVIRKLEARLEEETEQRANLTKQVCELERRVGVLMDVVYQQQRDVPRQQYQAVVNSPPAPDIYDKQQIEMQFLEVHKKLSSFEENFKGLHDNIANIAKAQHQFRAEQGTLQRMIKEVHSRDAIPKEVTNRLSMLEDMIRRIMQAFRQPRRSSVNTLDP